MKRLNDSDNNGNKKIKDGHKLVIAIIIIVIILLLLQRCSTYGTENNENTDTNSVSSSSSTPVFDLTPDEKAEQGAIQGKSDEEIQAELNEKVQAGMINISMNLNPVFKDGTSEGNLLIYNSDVNLHPQVVEIYLSGTDELLYKSGGIPVGSRVETGKLLKDLDAGTYECTAYFNAIDEETNQLVGKAGAEIKIIIQN